MRTRFHLTIVALAVVLTGIMAAAENVAPPSGGQFQSIDSAADRPLLSGFTLKFGYQTSPKANGFSDAWFAAVGYDIALGHNFALGLEIQPYTRSVSDSALSLDYSYLAARAWAILKGGVGLGGLIKFLKPVVVFAGVGAGGEGYSSKLTWEGDSSTKAGFNFGFMGTLGVRLNLGSVALSVEYQFHKIKDPNVDKGDWAQIVFIGLTF